MDQDENRIIIIRAGTIAYATFVDKLARRVVKHVDLNCRSAFVSHRFEQRDFGRSKTKNGHRNRGNADKCRSLINTENGSKDFQVQPRFASVGGEMHMFCLEPGYAKLFGKILVWSKAIEVNSDALLL